MTVALVASLLTGGLLLGACGGASKTYASPTAMAHALGSAGFSCTSVVSVSAGLLPAGVVQEGKCQVTKAPGLTSADLNVTGGVDVTFFVLKSGVNPSALADQVFHEAEAETAYGPDWVAEGSSQVYLGLAKALGGSYPADEKADLAPT